MTVFERIDLNARWGDRRESLDECASRAVNCLHKLAACDDVFGHWYKLGKSRKEALQHSFEPTFESCRQLLEKGRNRRDHVKTVIEELGYSMWLWNGASDESAINVRYQCGAYPAVSAMPVPNECKIDLPHSGATADRILREDKLILLMAIVAESWDPDWARVTSSACTQATGQVGGRLPEVGWLTYLSDRYGPLPALPSECRVDRLADLGSVIVIKGIDRLTASNPTHVGLIRNLSGVVRKG